MADLGEIYHFAQRDAGPWTPPGFPDSIEYDGNRWTKTKPFEQLVDFFDPRVVAGYREDIVGVGRSRHMVVFREPDGNCSFVVEHSESSPAHHPLEHATEVVIDFAKRHPFASAVGLGGLAWLLARALKK